MLDMFEKGEWKELLGGSFDPSLYLSSGAWVHYLYRELIQWSNKGAAFGVTLTTHRS